MDMQVPGGRAHLGIALLPSRDRGQGTTLGSDLRKEKLLDWLQARPQDHPLHQSLSAHLSCAPPSAAKNNSGLSSRRLSSVSPLRERLPGLLQR